MLVKTNICDEIMKELAAQRRSVRWLAEQIGCDHSNLSKRLKSNRSMDSDELASISDVLNVSFLQILHHALVEEKAKRGKAHQ